MVRPRDLPDTHRFRAQLAWALLFLAALIFRRVSYTAQAVEFNVIDVSSAVPGKAI
jgi:hypothetical protein